MSTDEPDLEWTYGDIAILGFIIGVGLALGSIVIERIFS